MSKLRELVENWEAGEEQIKELQQAQQATIDAALDAFAEHKVGDVIEGKRSQSGQPTLFKITRRYASLDRSHDGHVQVFISYHGVAMKRDGTPGQVASYLHVLKRDV